MVAIKGLQVVSRAMPTYELAAFASPRVVIGVPLREHGIKSQRRCHNTVMCPGDAI